MSDDHFLQAVESRRFQPVHYETEIAETLHAELHDVLKGRSSLGYADTNFANVIEGFNDVQLRGLNHAYAGLYSKTLEREVDASGIVNDATMKSLGRRLRTPDTRTKEDIELSRTYDQDLFTVERDLRMLSNALTTIFSESRETLIPYNTLADSANHFDAQITAEQNLAKKIMQWGSSGELVAMDAAERNIDGKSLVQVVEDYRVNPDLRWSNGLEKICREFQERINPKNTDEEATEHFYAQVRATADVAKLIAQWGATGELDAMDAAQRNISGRGLLSIVEDHRISPALKEELLRHLSTKWQPTNGFQPSFSEGLRTSGLLRSAEPISHQL